MTDNEQTVAEIQLLYQQQMTVRIPCNHVPPSPEEAYRLVKDAGPQTVVDALPCSWMDVTTSGNLNVVDIQEDDGLRADGSGETEGLYEKYEVRKDGEPVEDCFVLEPESDPAALEALKAYALETDEHYLAADLSDWIAEIERGESDAE